ncbi:hypothetical protein M405DRAFT_866390 [Rhizopogon salebrosus TDB-379]|nr:hypothetical protein M405DRAFT_866390 [Rhizopogon salebrosus TDB-379]
METLKGVLTYPHSPDYRPGIHGLTPVRDSIADINLKASGVPSLVTRNLRIYHAAFPRCFPCTCLSGNADGNFVSKTSHIHRVSKKVMPLMIKLYMRFTNDIKIYVDGTLEAVFSVSIEKRALGLPNTHKAKIVIDSVRRMMAFCDRISDMRVEGIWRQLIEVFRGGILTDCTAIEKFSLEDQEVENFDLSLISSLEIDLVPHLGDTGVTKVLHQGSQLYKSEMDPSHPDSPSTDTEKASD